MKKRTAAAMLAFLLAIIFSVAVSADQILSVKMDNTAVLQNSLEVYFSANTTGAVTKDQVSLSLGGGKLTADSVEPFSKSGEGISYIFLVDVSGSMKTGVEPAKTFLKQAIASLKDKDKAAVVTVAKSIQTGSFTADKSALNSQAEAIKSVSEDTNLYKGITSCIDLFASYQSQLTARKVLVVVSDGDEDFESGITKDEVLSKIAEARIPVFTYAILPSKPSSTQLDASKIFGSFARTSAGGADFTNSQKQDEILSKITAVLQNSYAVKAKIDPASYKGEKVYLELNLNINGVTVKDGYDLRVSALQGQAPGSASAASSSAGSTGSSSAAPVSSAASSGAAGGIKTFLQTMQKPQVWIPSAAGLLIVIALIVFLIVRKKKKSREELLEEPAPVENPPQDSGTVAMPELPPAPFPQSGFPNAASVETPPVLPVYPATVGHTAPMGGVQVRQTPAKPKITIRLVNISSNSGHEVYEKVLEDTFVIGRNSQKSKLAFPDDFMMSGRHCQLSYINHRVFLNDLGSTNGTFVNGVPITGSYQLESDDVIVIGSTELRIVFELQNEAGR